MPQESLLVEWRNNILAGIVSVLLYILVLLLYSSLLLLFVRAQIFTLRGLGEVFVEEWATPFGFTYAVVLLVSLAVGRHYLIHGRKSSIYKIPIFFIGIFSVVYYIVSAYILVSKPEGALLLLTVSPLLLLFVFVLGMIPALLAAWITKRVYYRSLMH